MFLMLIGGLGGFTTDLIRSLHSSDNGVNPQKNTSFFLFLSGVWCSVLILKHVDFDKRYIDPIRI